MLQMLEIGSKIQFSFFIKILISDVHILLKVNKKTLCLPLHPLLRTQRSNPKTGIYMSMSTASLYVWHRFSIHQNSISLNLVSSTSPNIPSDPKIFPVFNETVLTKNPICPHGQKNLTGLGQNPRPYPSIVIKLPQNSIFLASHQLCKTGRGR